ncbi:serine/threonine protein kinase [Glycomyces sp. A-F 0318]|uniref:serine/threonine-protein kinase n=1 Tax=Glycomyces amatae TaxID=2881355 RepID=UPI001E324AEE|nr:serine/threonine-protein kinase [Glycomyces amatae]MCD0442579.1 serine/threonine protein kinase [Glycomyces amatae]
MDETTDPFARVRERLAELLPDYRIDPAPVSTTGLSQVFLAEDARLHGRKVAVKAMAGYLSLHQAYRRRFLREIQLMAALEHPNIMYLIRASSPEDDLLYLVMPCAEDDLRRRLERGRLDLAATVDVVAQVAKALDHAHDHGVVHRDVKPGNILFGHGGHVYLSDFGVARDRLGPDLTAVGESIGTRRYTAPEVYDAGADRPGPEVREGPASPSERAGDVYSLGAVLYHCLTGRRPPVDGEQTDAAPAAEPEPKLPPALESLVAKAMHVDPARRYRTCGELAHALAQAAGVEEAGSALPILRDIQERLRAEPTDRTAPGRPWFQLLTPVIALVLLAAVLVYTAADRNTDRADAAGGEATAEPAESPTPEEDAGAEPIVPAPVTGDEQAERRPVEGECTTDSEDWVVVACDSELAAEYFYRIVANPEDPNPSQPDHDDAAWLACGADGVTDFEYYWRDSTDETEQPWDPETGIIYYIMCYQEV